ncbi:MAG TPA: DUF2306 domain-containing protein [Steroidobacteraceae bacterium]|nr:DUF2306 domain-containing protein [Steroidobacteraceae bacterium]
MTIGQPAPDRHFEAKHILFIVLGLLTLFVIYNNERFIVDHSDPQWAYYFPVRWLLVPHGLAGALCLGLGASQFSTRLRERHPALHRILGRCYIAGVAIAAPMSVYITMLHNALPTRIAIITQASLWLLATAAAFYCIRRRNFQQHRQWMIRSYAITLIFLTDRVIDAIPGLSDLDADTNPTVLWMCNLAAWVVPTFIIAWQNIFPPPALAGAAARRP